MARAELTAGDQILGQNKTPEGEMQNVTVRKAEALDTLKKNRDAHIKIFNEAIAGFRKQALQILEDRIAEITAGRVGEVSVNIPQPQNQTKEYDRAIKMLEMSVDDQINFDESSFASYIMDDWAWKRQFLHSNAMYSKAASAALASE